MSSYSHHDRDKSPGYPSRYLDSDRQSTDLLIHRSNVALTSYHDCLSSFELHVNRYLTRYLDLHGTHYHRSPAETPLGYAIDQSRPTSYTEQEQRVIATSRSLQTEYQNCELPGPFRDIAVRDLLDWGDYLRSHRSKTRIPTRDEIAYENRKRAAAEMSAEILWGEYKHYVGDKHRWTIDYYAHLGHQVFEGQVEATTRADDNSHLMWLKEHQSHRLPPSRLRPDALEFLPSSPSAKDVTILQISHTYFPDENRAPVLGNYESSDPTESPFSKKALMTPDTSDEEAEAKQDRETDFPTRRAPSSSDLNHFEASKVEEERVKEIFHNYEDDIIFRSAYREPMPARAFLDTGNRGPNVISEAFVQNLGLFGQIRHFDEGNAPRLQGIDGSHFIPIGKIKLFWRLDSLDYIGDGWKLCEFHVSRADNIQVVFSLLYMIEINLLPASQPVVPVIPNKKARIDTPERRAMAAKQAQGIQRANRVREDAQKHIWKPETARSASLPAAISSGAAAVDAIPTNQRSNSTPAHLSSQSAGTSINAREADHLNSIRHNSSPNQNSSSPISEVSARALERKKQTDHLEIQPAIRKIQSQVDEVTKPRSQAQVSKSKIRSQNTVWNSSAPVFVPRAQASVLSSSPNPALASPSNFTREPNVISNAPLESTPRTSIPTGVVARTLPEIEAEEGLEGGNEVGKR